MIKNKQRLKEKYLSIRKSLPSYDVFIKSWYAQENFLKSNFFSKSRIIGIYYPIHNEVQTFRIIHQSLSKSKIICLPKLIDKKLLFYEFDQYDKVEIGSYGIMEPLIDNKNLTTYVDTIVTPGIVFDRRGFRIGYGKGYYDKFFKFSHNDIKIIGLCYEFQLVSHNIDNEPHDIRMDTIMTNTEVISF